MCIPDRPSPTLIDDHNIQPTYKFQLSKNDEKQNYRQLQGNGRENLPLKHTNYSAGFPAFTGAPILNRNNIDSEKPFIHHKIKQHPPSRDSNLSSKFLINGSNKENTDKVHEGRNGSPLSNPRNINTNFEYRIRSPSNFEAEFSSVVGDKTGDISNSLGPNFSHRISHRSSDRRDEFQPFPPEINKKSNSLNRSSYYNSHSINADNIVSEQDEHAKRTERDSSTADLPVAFYGNRGDRRERLYTSSNLNNENTEAHIPLYKPEAHKPNFYFQDPHKLVENHHPLGSYENTNRHINRNIETESLSKDSQSSNNETARDRFPIREDTFEIPQDPDVSVNVLEVPRFTHKFENLTSEKIPNTPLQGSEESHNVFGGFYGSKESHPVLEQDYFYNPYVHHNGANQKVNSFHNPISQSLDSIPIPQNIDHIVTKYSQHSGVPFLSLSRSVTTPAELPAFEEPSFKQIHQESTSSSPLQLITVPTPESIHEKSTDQSILNRVLYSPPSTRYGSVSNVLPPNRFPIHRSNTHYDNSLRLIPNAFLTTEASATRENQHGNSNHRSDTPSEDGGGVISVQTVTPTPGVIIPNKIYSHSPVLNNTSNEGFPPHQVRLQNVLRDFKPDEIIIDIGNIPTPQPSQSTAGFQQRRIVANQTPLKSRETNIGTDKRSEQISGTTWRSSHIETTRHPRRRNNKFPKQPQNGVSFHVRKSSMSRHHQFNNSQGFIQEKSFEQPQISRHPQVHSSQLHQFHPPHHFDSPRQFNGLQQVNQFDNPRNLHVLPPGVSMHPRHPQAPYADMVNSNRPPNIHPRNGNHASIQPHRQRHHRKKERFPNSCCRMIGKPNALQACCRSGGHCCSGPRTGTHQSRTPCCSSNKIAQNKKLFSASPNQLPARAEFRPQETRRTFVDSRNQCQREKMCRTLYESTQQVMVCRSANIEGC